MTMDPARTEDLLRELRWTRRLALDLASDASRADDIVQEAWARFLASPRGSIQNVRGWFRAVLRRLAISRDAADAFEEFDERRFADGVAGADVPLQRVELQHALVGELLALDPEHRRLLVMRYFQGLRGSVIAARLGISPSTARGRLQRARTVLLERLNQRGGAERWAPALAFLGRFSPRKRLQVAAARSIAAAAVAVAILGATSYSFGARDDSAPSALLGSSGRQAPGDVGGLEAGVARASVERRTAPAQLDARTMAGGEHPSSERAAAQDEWIEVLLLVDGQPAGGGEFLVGEGRGWIEPGSVPRYSIGPGGVARLPRGTQTSLRLAYVRRPGDAPVLRSVEPKVAGDRARFDVGSGVISGRVFDSDGRPAPGVIVTLGQREAYDYGAVAARVAADAQGGFRFDNLLAAPYLIAVDAPGFFGVRALGTLERGERTSISIGSPSSRELVRGHVATRAGGAPIDAGRSCLGAVAFQRVDDAGPTGEWCSADLDVDGAFSVELAPGRYEARRVLDGASYDQRLDGSFEVVPGATLPDVSLLLPGCRLRGLVAGPSGQPARARLMTWRRDGTASERDRQDVRTANDGSYLIDGVRAGRWTVQLDGSEESWEVLVTPDDRELELDWVVQ